MSLTATPATTCPDSAPLSAKRPRRNAGFTLLEVMLAFAILAVITGSLGQLIHENMIIAADAIDQREMREIADTIFGKFLFEQDEHRDGDEGSIAVEYGQWAGLPQERADRYAIYRWRLRKAEIVAAGTTDPNDDAESLTEDDNESSSSSGSSEEDAADADKTSIKLIRFTLTVFREGSREDPLITLTRFLPPPEFQETGK